MCSLKRKKNGPITDELEKRRKNRENIPRFVVSNSSVIGVFCFNLFIIIIISNITIGLMFAGVNMILARLKLILDRAKRVLK